MAEKTGSKAKKSKEVTAVPEPVKETQAPSIEYKMLAGTVVYKAVQSPIPHVVRYQQDNLGRQHLTTIVVEAASWGAAEVVADALNASVKTKK